MTRRTSDIVAASLVIFAALAVTFGVGYWLNLPDRWARDQPLRLVWEPPRAWRSAWVLSWYAVYVVWVWALGALTALGVLRPLSGARLVAEVGIVVVVVLFATDSHTNNWLTGWGFLAVIASLATAVVCGGLGWAVRNRRRDRPRDEGADE